MSEQSDTKVTPKSKIPSENKKVKKKKEAKIEKEKQEKQEKQEKPDKIYDNYAEACSRPFTVSIS